MLRFEAEPTREPEPSPAYGNDVFRAGMRAFALDRAARAMRRVIPGYWITLDEARALYPDPSDDEPCDCDPCRLMRRERAAHVAAAPEVDRIMAGVDMPGRIIDDVRPDQRGES